MDKYTLPAGEYYVGDLCYLINEKVWGDFCETVLFSGSDGVVMKKGWRNPAPKLAWFNTLYGDGGYIDQFGNNYNVDAGIIGCFNIANLTEGDNDPNELVASGSAAVHRFNEPFTCDAGSDGILRFGHIVIDTGVGDEDYE